jgi:hypothetical protein
MRTDYQICRALLSSGVSLRCLPDGSIVLKGRQLDIAQVKRAIRAEKKSRRRKAKRETRGRHSAPRWHRSLHHESSHLVVDGEAVCGAKKLSDGWREIPAGESMRRCTRCMGWEARQQQS